MNTNEELYTKQASYKMKKAIYDKLNDSIEEDLHIKMNNNRWIYSK